jgi:AcrR family transcriptional regulator
MRPRQTTKKAAAPPVRGDDVRARLLAAAAALIPELGWHAVTTRAVAQRAGVTAGLVHYHFGSVQGLLRDAAVAAIDGALAEVADVTTGAGTPEAGVDALLGALDAHTGTDSASLLFAEAFLAATRDTALREALTGLLAGLTDLLATWLARCGHPQPAPTAAVLAAAVDGVLLHRALAPHLTGATVAPPLHRLVAAGGEGAA